MNRTCLLLSIVCLPVLLARSPAAFAASLEVNLGETVVVGPGEVYDNAVVRNGGILILDGGEIGAHAVPSVLVEAGGRFVFNNGLINYFENRGVTELYGGTQSDTSSENRGYLKIAGGDPGMQLVHFDGTVDVYSSSTNRAVWEIDTSSNETHPMIRFYAVANSLAPGTYTYGMLEPASHHPYGKSYPVDARFWPNTQMLVRVEVNMESDWAGTVWSQAYVAPPAPFVHTRPAIEIHWAAEAGRSYQVQFTTNLLTGSWHNLGLPVRARGPSAYVLDTTPDTNKSYRVMMRH